jgi:predicted lysophospholipase L1 biosynthesis ABC-type transport system permease subunit
MRPLGFLTGVVLGSAASIALVLLMVVLTLALAASGRAAAAQEYPGLLVSAALFGILAAFAGAAFAGLQRVRPWRWLAQSAMWLWLAAIAWFYWPAGGAPGG